MIISLSRYSSLSDGKLISKIISVSDVNTNNGKKIAIDFLPKDENDNPCESVRLWVGREWSGKKLLFKLLDVLEIFFNKQQVSTEELSESLMDETVGVVIKVNEKNGITYFNIVDFFETDEEFGDDIEYKEDEDELEEDGNDELEDDEDEELEDEDDEEDEDEDDDEPEISVRRGNRSNRRNKGRNNRR